MGIAAIGATNIGSIEVKFRPSFLLLDPCSVCLYKINMNWLSVIVTDLSLLYYNA